MGLDPISPVTENDNQQPNLSNSDTTDVEVKTEIIGERQRQISAKIAIPQPVELIWHVLTDYEALAEFIPNLAKSCRLEHPTGGIRLEQIGSSRLLRFNFCARVVLDLEEHFPHEIRFQMVEGDFKAFSGCWRLEGDSLSGGTVNQLSYIIQVWPKLTMPIAMIERRLSSDLQLNLLAIRDRVRELSRKQ
ncbi:MAG: SRPBCC family protein [Nostocaceae cyanobacterium]|nr:SRPBCC family protein [Nostocaceae cyanobacterium]